jgi:GTP-binding protein
MSNFIDEVKLYAKAGDGGHGAVAWRREAHVPKGGPAGGDGGDGGDVVFVGDDGVHSLLDFKYDPRLVARNGEAGRGKKQAGHRSDDVVALVPLGTRIFDADSGELLGDITAHGQRLVVCKGGNGGFGNSRFATASVQAPEFAKPGLPGEERNLRLSLTLMADVGLLGFPNAGKSTFVARVSAARPKIADYPFTTLVPQLGVVKVPSIAGKGAEHLSFVIADIPGLVEGAHEGKGLGVRFLKHLERVRVLLHLIEVPLEVAESQYQDGAVVDDAPASAVRGPIDLVERYTVLRRELENFSAALAARPEVVALNKTDLLVGDPAALPAVTKLQQHLAKQKIPLLFLSSASGHNRDQVLLTLWQKVQQEKPQPAPASSFDPALRERYPQHKPE